MSEQSVSAPQSGRKFYLDVARVLAILSISMNHAVNRAYENFDFAFYEFRQIPLSSSFTKVIAIVFGHIGVPLFLMISGALLLNKHMETEEDVKRFYRHNLLPLVITTEIWYVIMYLFIQCFHTDWTTITPVSFLSGLVSTVLFTNQTTMDSMWYMPMIICLYMVVPYLAMVLKKVSLRMLALPLAVVYLADMIIPTINDVFKLHYVDMWLNFVLRSSNLFSIYLLYMVPGWWAANGGLARVKTRWIAGGAALISVVCCVFQFYAYSRPVKATFDYNFALLPILAVLLFELIRRWGHRLERLQRPITYIAKISFAIYFVHILIMSLLEWYFPYSSWYKPLSMLFLEAVSLSGSIVVIAVLSKLPFCRKHLFMVKG